MLVEELLSQW